MFVAGGVLSWLVWQRLRGGGISDPRNARHDALCQLEREKNEQIARLELDLRELRAEMDAKLANCNDLMNAKLALEKTLRETEDRQIGTISFYDKEGKEYKNEATEFEVPEVPGDIVSINVEKGIWIVYTEAYFKGVSFLLKPGQYKDPRKTTQVLVPDGKWTGQIRSLRAVTPGSMMLFDQDNFLGNCLVIKDSTDVGTKSMIIEPDPNTKARKQSQVDLVFVLDGSRSIKTENFKTVKQFTVKMLRGMDISSTTTRVGVVQYSEDVTLEIKLEDHNEKDSMETAINKVEYQKGRSTKTGEALKYVRTKMDWRKSAKQVVIVLTDGQAKDDVVTHAKDLRRDNFLVFAVGVGVESDELVKITQDHGKVFQLNDFGKLRELIENIKNSVSQGTEWEVYNSDGRGWQAFPGYYTSADLEKNLGGRVDSVKRLV